MGKILLCLVIALLLGFLIGWLFSKALTSEKRSVNNDNNEDENQSQSIFEELEQKYETEKALAESYAIKNRELKGELMKKISILESTSERLKDIQIYDKDDTSKIAELEKRLKKKEAELMEFETILVKAEETIEKLSQK